MMKSERRWLLLLKEEEAVVHDACILLPCMRDRKIKGSVSAGVPVRKEVRSNHPINASKHLQAPSIVFRSLDTDLACQVGDRTSTSSLRQSFWMLQT